MTVLITAIFNSNIAVPLLWLNLGKLSLNQIMKRKYLHKQVILIK